MGEETVAHAAEIHHADEEQHSDNDDGEEQFGAVDGRIMAKIGHFKIPFKIAA